MRSPDWARSLVTDPRFKRGSRVYVKSHGKWDFSRVYHIEGFCSWNGYPMVYLARKTRDDLSWFGRTSAPLDHLMRADDAITQLGDLAGGQR